MLDDSGGWEAATDNHLQWLQIDLGSEMYVRGVVTQGHRDKEAWVTKSGLIPQPVKTIHFRFVCEGGREECSASFCTSWRVQDILSLFHPKPKRSVRVGGSCYVPPPTVI